MHTPGAFTSTKIIDCCSCSGAVIFVLPCKVIFLNDQHENVSRRYHISFIYEKVGQHTWHLSGLNNFSSISFSLGLLREVCPFSPFCFVSNNTFFLRHFFFLWKTFSSLSFLFCFKHIFHLFTYTNSCDTVQRGCLSACQIAKSSTYTESSNYFSRPTAEFLTMTIKMLHLGSIAPLVHHFLPLIM